jgi:peptidoglycan/LPS O-acetylase OafA/YrhL
VVAPAPPPRRLGVVPELDVVRGVAVVLVIIAHVWIIWPTWVFADQLTGGGFLGVDLFFVLSGFLITALLLGEHAERGAVGIRAFYWRRAVRLLPALWLLLAAYAVYAVIDGHPPFGRSDWTWGTVRASALFHMNWHVLWHPLEAADLTPLWSVAIEVQFYVVWPLVVAGLLARSRSRAVVIGSLFALLAAVSARRLWLFETDGWEAAYLRSDSHVDGLVVGALLACAWARGWTPARLPRWLLWVAALGAGALVTQLRADERITYAGGTTVFLVLCATVVLVVVTDQRPLRGPLAQAAALLGRVSYGVYLWHFPVLWVVTRHGTHLTNVERFGLALGATTAGVAASRYLVELPALRRARRRVTAETSPSPARRRRLARS